MRIALMPSAYAPAVGGVEVLTHRLALQLLSAGDDVEVWAPRYPEDLPADEEIAGVRVRRFVLPLPPAQLKSLLGAPRHAARGTASLVRAVKDFHPDVLHVQCFSNNGVYAALIAALGRRPLIVTLQGETVMDDHDLFERSVLLRAALRAALRRAAAVTACSEFVLADAVERFGLPPGVGRVIFNGVDTDESVASTTVAVPFDRYVLGLGRVVTKKGFDLLVEAWTRLGPKYPNVGLVVAGCGPELSSLRDLARRNGVASTVHFTGAVTQPQVEWLMGHADLFVLPSRVEPFGIVVLEALRAGRPVVVSSRGGAREIVTHGREGLVVDPFDTTALAGAIGRLLDDEGLRASMGRIGRGRVAGFQWRRIAAEYRSVYRAVVPA